MLPLSTICLLEFGTAPAVWSLFVVQFLPLLRVN